MPRKRKTKKSDINITVKEPEPVEEVEVLAEDVQVPITCIGDSRLIVGADKTPSGTRYEFNAGETKQVLLVDYEFLLSLRSRAPGCCGGGGGSGSVPSVQKYFEEVN